MKINNENFETFLFDNVESVKNRIAATKMNTLLKYLVFEPEITSITQEGNIVVKNVLDPVLNKSFLDYPLSTQNYKRIRREDFERFFIVTNTTLLKTTNEQFLKALLITMRNFTLDPEKVWNDRKIILKSFDDELNELKLNVQEHTKLSLEFERIPEIAYTTFETTNAQFTVDFGPTNMSMSELFNMIQVTKYVPYINMDNFYKIYFDFVPSREWTTLQTKNVILMKVDCEIQTELRSFKNPFKKFTNAAFTILENEGGPNQLIATMDMNVGYRNVQRKEFIRRVFASLNMKGTLNTAIKNIQEISIVGYCSFPNQTMFIPVFSDLIMNNLYFYPLIAINESIRASKTKLNIYLHMVGNGMDSTSLMMKTTEKPNMYGMANEGEKYIRSRIKTKTLKDVLNYQKMIARFFTLYNNEKNNISTVYKEFLPNFLKDENMLKKKITKNEMGLRSIAPELFLPNYSRKCLKRPTIISDNEALEYERTGEKQVMYFPYWGESKKHNYVCNHDTHPYPGLRDNQLENKETYPFLPCCYSKDQKKRKGSKYRHYYEREDLKKRHQQSQDLYITSKILPAGISGMLPKNIKDLFSLFESNPKYKFIRIGMNKTKHSLLECVLVAKNRYNSLDPKARGPLILAEKNKLAVEKYAMAAKQELYNESIEDIIQKILNDDMNAAEFVHLMEEAFDCNIFVFVSDDRQPNGELIIPKHTQAYFKMKPTKDTILIYQHEGSESDNAFRPQCELIARVDVDGGGVKKNTYLFNPNNEVIIKLWSIFRKLNRSFIFDTMMPSVSIKKMDVKSQIVDLYGKCRVINVYQKIGISSEIITIISDPIPPFAAVSAQQIYRASLKAIKLFADEMEIDFITQKVNNNKVREITATMSQGNINITFLSDDSGRLQNVPMVVVDDDEEGYKNIFKKANNIVTRFNLNKKLSRIIFQYLLYIFSIYINNIFKSPSGTPLQPQPLTENQLVQFVNDKIVVIPNYNYEYKNGIEIIHSSKFDLNSVFLDKNKLITTSTEMVKRLMFMLRLYQSNNFDKLIKYKNKTDIEDFYEDISDFDKKSFEILLDGSRAVDGLIESYKTQNTITKNVKPNEYYSYFFYNEYLAKTIYIAQNAQSLQIAINFVKFWHQYGYNPTATIISETIKIGGMSSDYVVDIYSYVSDKSITKIGDSNTLTTKNSTKTNQTSQYHIPGAVLAYLYNKQPTYTALMPL